MRREEGATAILIALLTLFVLLPLAGAATSTFVRAGTIAELQLAADAGALAGASSIPVGDLGFALTYAADFLPNNDDIDNALADLGFPESPLDIACAQARKALASNGLLGDTFDSGTADPIPCDPQYLGDPAFAVSFSECVKALPVNPDPVVVDIPGVTSTVIEVPSAGNILIKLAGTLPGLLHPGIRVTLSRNIDPPLESLIDPADSASDEHEAVAYARRRFKNAVVLPVLPVVVVPPVEPPVLGDPVQPLPNPLVPETVIDLGRVLRTTPDELDKALDALQKAIDDSAPGEFPAACRQVLPALRDDLGDLANPPEEGAPGPDADEILGDAERTDSDALILRIVEGTPFFDFFPVCVEKFEGDFVGRTGCAARAPGAFRAALVPPP